MSESDSSPKLIVSPMPLALVKVSAPSELKPAYFMAASNLSNSAITPSIS